MHQVDRSVYFLFIQTFDHSIIRLFDYSIVSPYGSTNVSFSVSKSILR